DRGVIRGSYRAFRHSQRAGFVLGGAERGPPDDVVRPDPVQAPRAYRLLVEGQVVGGEVVSVWRGRGAGREDGAPVGRRCGYPHKPDGPADDRARGGPAVTARSPFGHGAVRRRPRLVAPMLTATGLELRAGARLLL